MEAREALFTCCCSGAEFMHHERTFLNQRASGCRNNSSRHSEEFAQTSQRENMPPSLSLMYLRRSSL